MAARLVINTTILSQARRTGLGVYVEGLLPPLVTKCLGHPGWSEILLAGRPDRVTDVLGSLSNQSRVKMIPIDTCHPVARLFALDRLAVRERKRGGEPLFYSPTHHGIARGGIRQVITIHDLFARLFPHNYRQQYWYFRWYLPRILSRCDQVIVDSASTGEDLRRFYPASPAFTVVPAALRRDFTDTQPREVAELANTSFFLFVGPNYWYKNCLRLIDAFAAYRREGSGKLVFVGGQENYLKTLREHLNQKYQTLTGDVVFLDYVPTDQLIWLYRHATALMVTTLYEGFGLPALEAMACDCPVIASRAGSLPEVCGEAALFVEPKDIDGIARAMTEIKVDLAQRQWLIAAGRENVERYSWEASAGKVFELLTAVGDRTLR